MSRLQSAPTVGALHALVGWALLSGIACEPEVPPTEPANEAVSAVDEGTLFELDGNPQDPGGAAAPDDWATLDAGGGFADTYRRVTEGVGQTIFMGGGSKDIHDIPSWRYRDGSVPDEDELLDGFAAVYADDAGDLILYFGADRFSNDGDARIGFWFLQDGVGLPTGRFSGEHMD